MENIKPEISIIVPIYNVEDYLDKCINSIINQKFKNIEVILVNDGSTDNSRIICEKYLEIDNRITVLHKKNGGVSSARNSGIKIAKGNYIGFVDPDDWIYEDMFEKLFNLAKQTKSDICICGHCREINGDLINHEVCEEYTKEMNAEESMNELFKGRLYRFALWNKLFKKDCFEGIEFPEGRIHEDLSTTYKLFHNARKVVYTNYIGYVYVKRYNSILTTKFNKNRLQSFEAWDEILQFMDENYSNIYDTVIACFTYWSIDNMYYILAQISKEKSVYLKTIQKSLRENYKSIIKSKLISAKYKIITSLLTISVNLTILVNKLRKRVV